MSPHTAIQDFALLIGVAYLAGGVLGFVPGVMQPPPTNAPELVVQTRF